MIVADDAADMWALGLVAFELLSEAAVFPALLTSHDDIIDRLCGRKQLPWEEEDSAAAAKLRALAGLRRGVVGCLERSPNDRPTSESVRMSWRRLFEQRTTETAAG